MEIFELLPAVIASEAKQSIPAHRKGLDCFVTTLLAMTKTNDSIHRRIP